MQSMQSKELIKRMDILRHMVDVISEIIWACENETLESFSSYEMLVSSCAQNIIELGNLPNLLENDYLDLLPRFSWNGAPKELWDLIQNKLRPLGEKITNLLLEISTYSNELSDEDICSFLRGGHFIELTEKDVERLNARFGSDLVRVNNEDMETEKSSHPNYFLRYYADIECSFLKDIKTVVFSGGTVTLLCGSRRMWIPLALGVTFHKPEYPLFDPWTGELISDTKET